MSNPVSLNPTSVSIAIALVTVAAIVQPRWWLRRTGVILDRSRIAVI